MNFLNRSIIKTSAWTLFFAFVTFSYGIVAFGWIRPDTMAGFCDLLGANNAAAMYYERQYARDKSAENLYLVLDRYILAENHSKVIEYGDKFFALEKFDYDKIIAKENKVGKILADGNKYNLVNWANEDNRVKCAYVVSLLAKGKNSRAEAKLVEWLEADINYEQPNHAFYAFLGKYINENIKNKFENYFQNFASGFKNFEGDRAFGLDFLLGACLYFNNSACWGEFEVEYNEVFNAI